MIQMENIKINKENEAAKTTTLEEANFFNNKYKISLNHKDNNENNFTNNKKQTLLIKILILIKQRRKNCIRTFNIFKPDEKFKWIITDLKIDAKTNLFKYDNKEYYLYSPKNQRKRNKISWKCKIYRSKEHKLVWKKIMLWTNKLL